MSDDQNQQPERQLRIKPEAQEMLANNPVWRRIWDRLFQPLDDEHEQRINERLDRYGKCHDER